MSTIAPKFRLSYFIKSITDNTFWAILLLTLIGIPFVQVILFYLQLPVIDDKLITPYLALTILADPSRQIPLLKSF
ncbi:MAG: NADH-quinone oxidoreductase subunit H, partial [Candidatus Nitrosotenuis sp.]